MEIATRAGGRSAFSTMAMSVHAVTQSSKCAEYAGGISGTSLAADDGSSRGGVPPYLSRRPLLRRRLSLPPS
jgi:hypothetical protein